MRFLLVFYSHFSSGVSTLMHASCQWSEYILHGSYSVTLLRLTSGKVLRPPILTHLYLSFQYLLSLALGMPATLLPFFPLKGFCVLGSAPWEDCFHCLESSLHPWLPATACFASKMTWIQSKTTLSSSGTFLSLFQDSKYSQCYSLHWKVNSV